MKNVIFLSILMCSASLLNAQNLLNAPQKIVIDEARNRLLVSNFGNGALVEIDSSGHQEYFEQNANFVDGLEIVGDTVYGVGNNRYVRAYNLETKELVMDIRLTGSGSNYLSSVTSDSSGHLFISCPSLDEIYKLRISDQSYWTFFAGHGINEPNGILLEKEKNRIVIIEDSPSPSRIQAISLLDSTRTTLDTNTFHRPDGIVRDKNGYYYVGGYFLPGIYKINPDFSGEPELFFAGNNMVYPTYNAKNHSLYITYYNQNDWGEIPLGSSSVSPDESLNDFRLYNNYPNPFNPGTTIKYAIPESQLVDLKVYDLLGSEVKTLVNEEKPAGEYNVEFRIDNVELSSGLYFYKLRAGSFVQTKKMVLLK